MKRAHLIKALDKAETPWAAEAVWAQHAADKAEGEAFDQAIRDNIKIKINEFPNGHYVEITARTDYLMSVQYFHRVTDLDLFHNKEAIQHAVEICRHKIIRKIRETLMP